VREVSPAGISADALLELAAYAESASSHPISVSLKNAYGKELDNSRVSDIEEFSGLGVTAFIGGKNIAVGNAKLMQKLGVEFNEAGAAGTNVYVAQDSVYKGHILIADDVKPDSRKAIQDLKTQGVKKIGMLTGDSASVAREAALTLGIDTVFSGLLPDGKVERVEALLAEKSPKGRLIFAGDGINDAPVLARADIGIAMGALGSDAAVEAADVVIMTDKPSKIPEAVRISKKTLRIARENIVLALSVKAAVLILGAAGIASMWAAVFADVGVSSLAVLNAMRMLKAAS
jgi:Cd2+/Zn2+-exporting ATPase